MTIFQSAILDPMGNHSLWPRYLDLRLLIADRSLKVQWYNVVPQQFVNQYHKSWLYPL